MKIIRPMSTSEWRLPTARGRSGFAPGNKRITPEADGTYKFTFPKAGDYTLTIQVRMANMYVREYTVKLPHTVPEEHA